MQLYVAVRVACHIDITSTHLLCTCIVSHPSISVRNIHICSQLVSTMGLLPYTTYVMMGINQRWNHNMSLGRYVHMGSSMICDDVCNVVSDLDMYHVHHSSHTHMCSAFRTRVGHPLGDERIQQTRTTTHIDIDRWLCTTVEYEEGTRTA